MSELIIVKSFSVINIQDITVETPTSSVRCVQIYAKCMNWEEEGHINILTKDTFSLVCDETLEAGGRPRAVPGVAGHPYREYWQSIDRFQILTLISQLKSEQVVIGPLTAMKMKSLAGKEAQKFLHFYLRLVIDPIQVGIVYVYLYIATHLKGTGIWKSMWRSF